MMVAGRFEALSAQYASLRIAVVGDYFLDRYLRIDSSRSEISIETGLPVHNVVEVIAQPGAAGTIVNNLVALGVGEIHAVGFCGDDGEGYELRRALGALSGVRLDHFLTTTERRTPVYCKPLVVEAGKAPVELNRLDAKNWTPTPPRLTHDLAARVRSMATEVDALVMMEQVERPNTGVITLPVATAAHEVQAAGRLVLADSRRGLGHMPPVLFKMNATELARMTKVECTIEESIASLSSRNGRPVFVTLAESGIIGAEPGREPEHVAAHPARGEIDVVGAGDAVTANLVAALAAGATVREAMEIAMAAASIVVHQVGTTGTACPAQIAAILRG